MTNISLLIVQSMPIFAGPINQNIAMRSKAAVNIIPSMEAEKCYHERTAEEFVNLSLLA